MKKVRNNHYQARHILRKRFISYSCHFVGFSLGYYFIDRNGKYFEPILDYLRCGELILPVGMRRDHILKEMEFYGILHDFPVDTTPRSATPVQKPAALQPEPGFADALASRHATTIRSDVQRFLEQHWPTIRQKIVTAAAMGQYKLDLWIHPGDDSDWRNRSVAYFVIQDSCALEPLLVALSKLFGLHGCLIHDYGICLWWDAQLTNLRDDNIRNLQESSFGKAGSGQPLFWKHPDMYFLCDIRTTSDKGPTVGHD
jgi:hypothetical protein